MPTTPDALKLAAWLRSTVQTYPQVSEDEPGGYCSEMDQYIDEAATLIEQQHAAIESLRAELGEFMHDAGVDNSTIKALRAEVESLHAGRAVPEPVKFFSFGEDSGYIEHDTADEAKRHANADLDVYRKDAQFVNEWPTEAESVCWGVIVQKSTEVDESEEVGQPSFDYVLAPPLSAAPTPPQAEQAGKGSEVLGIIATWRDVILNSRSNMEGVLDNDQTNEVLAVFDDMTSEVEAIIASSEECSTSKQLRAVERLLDGSQPIDIPGALMVIRHGGTHPAPQTDDARDAREVFEEQNKDSHGFRRSRRGTYTNPPIARDWKWFQLGINYAKGDLE